MRKLILILLWPLQLFCQNFGQEEIAGWEQQAKDITIIRDNWGIPHIYGKTDADCVFGLMYAQCEDDFKRVEMNYIEKLGRLAEIKGESELYNDLLIRLVADSADAVADYDKSPSWLKKLLNAFANGMNYYLYKYPGVKPALLHRFKPWYPLMWTNGSISSINTAGVSVNELKNLYTGTGMAQADPLRNDEELSNGSNGFAIGPSRTASGKALMYINPHVSFYFRGEVHVISEEGLNAYGAVTWGQFFIYQGFNQHCGWMHTSSGADVADLYAEKMSKNDAGWFYEYNNKSKPVKIIPVTLKYLKAGTILTQTIPVLVTHHGPVMAKRNDQWLSVRANNRSLDGLIQSWQRTKCKGFAEFKKTMELRANPSDNTVFADDSGHIAYWHGNFMPRRDKAFNWAKPVDGSVTATEWKGLHAVDETVHIYNPSNGWIQNCNSTPFTSAGGNSPKKENYPIYMAPDGENFRGINAVRVLNKEKKFTIDKLIFAGYNTYLAAFELLLPALFKAYDSLYSKNDSIQKLLREPIILLKQWDLKSSESSVATTLAIEWAQKLMPKIMKPLNDDEELDGVQKTKRFAATAQASELIQPLQDVIVELKMKLGTWKIAWGQLNRYQRLSGTLNERFDDSQSSWPVGMAASTWGCLPSFVSRSFPGTRKRYGYNGNSFICAVEFGKKIKAKSLLTGGESDTPSSPHFTDQALMYTKGQFKDVLFYKEDVLVHAERTYHPGE